MKMVLDLNEMIAILEEHFDCAPGELKITLTTVPEFGATLDGIPLPGAARSRVREESVVLPSKTPVHRETRRPVIDELGLPSADDDPGIAEMRSDDGASTDFPPVSADEIGDGEAPRTEGLSPAALMAQSQALKAQLDQRNPSLVEQGARFRRGGGGLRGTTKTPAYSDDENG